MNPVKFKPLLLALLVLLFAPNPALAQESMTPLPDIDVRLPRVQVRPPVAPTVLDIYKTLPNQSFFSVEVEPSWRLETNPFQAPQDNPPFNDATDVFRLQSNVTAGYAFTPKTRVSAQYFLLTDQYNDFIPAVSLDSTSHSVGLTLDHTLLQRPKWMLRTSATARQVFLSNGGQTGDIIPSLTWVRSIGQSSWVFLNTALDLSRSDFVIGSTQRLSPIVTLGTGTQIPYDSPRAFLKLLGGAVLSLSTTYSHTTDYRPQITSPDDYDNVIVTAEITKPVARKSPLQVFLRAEPVFNFGHHTSSIGVSGINFRLFAGLRLMAFNKPAIFTVNLDGGQP